MRFLVVVVLLAGCVQPALAPGEDPFIASEVTCGFGPFAAICPQRFITGDGIAAHIEGSWVEGSGRVMFDGPHPGLTSAAAREWLEIAGIYQTDRDYILEDSFEVELSKNQMRNVQAAAAPFHATLAEHNQHNNEADARTTCIEVHAADWSHRSCAYAGRGDEPYETLYDHLNELFLDLAGSQS